MMFDNTIFRFELFSYNAPCISKKSAYYQMNTLDITYAYADVCQSMRLLTAGSLVRVQLGEPVKSLIFQAFRLLWT